MKEIRYEPDTDGGGSVFTKEIECKKPVCSIDPILDKKPLPPAKKPSGSWPEYPNRGGNSRSKPTI